MVDDGHRDEKTGDPIGTWGIKQAYLQETPAALFPPMNFQGYKKLLVLDDLVKGILTGQEPSYSMIKTQMDDFKSNQQADRELQNIATNTGKTNVPRETPAAAFAGNTTDAVLQLVN